MSIEPSVETKFKEIFPNVKRLDPNTGKVSYPVEPSVETKINEILEDIVNVHADGGAYYSDEVKEAKKQIHDILSTQQAQMREEIKGLMKKEVSDPDVEFTIRHNVDWANEKRKTCKLCQKSGNKIHCKRHSPYKARITTRIYRPFNDGYNQAITDALTTLEDK
jgi:hypothetical protein